MQAGSKAARQPRRPGSPRLPAPQPPAEPLPRPGDILLCADLEFNIPPKSPERGEEVAPLGKPENRCVLPPKRVMPKTYKPPWDFSGPDPKPREYMNGPPPDAMLTAAKVDASVRKALRLVRFIRLRVDKARRVAEGASDESYQQQTSAEQHAQENPTLVGFENGAALEETRVMLSLRELGMAAMKSEMACSDYAWGMQRLHDLLDEYHRRLEAAQAVLHARVRAKPPITKRPADSGGDDELWAIQCTCREANALVDEARRACNRTVGHSQANLAKCAHATHQLHSATFIMLKSPQRAQRVVERFEERRGVLREVESTELAALQPGEEPLAGAASAGHDAPDGEQQQRRQQPEPAPFMGRTGRGARVQRHPTAALGVPRGSVPVPGGISTRAAPAPPSRAPAPAAVPRPGGEVGVASPAGQGDGNAATAEATAAVAAAAVVGEVAGVERAISFDEMADGAMEPSQQEEGGEGGAGELDPHVESHGEEELELLGEEGYGEEGEEGYGEEGEEGHGDEAEEDGGEEGYGEEQAEEDGGEEGGGAGP